MNPRGKDQPSEPRGQEKILEEDCLKIWVNCNNRMRFWFLGWEDSPGGGNDNPCQYSCLKNPMDRGAWWATAHEVAKSRTWLSARVHAHTRGINTIIIDEIKIWNFFPEGQQCSLDCVILLPPLEESRKCLIFLSRSREKITNMKEKKGKTKKLHELARLDRCFHIAEKKTLYCRNTD